MAPQRITLPEPAVPRDDTGLRVLARDARTILPRDEKAYADLNTQALIRSLTESSEDFRGAVYSYMSVGREEKKRLEEAELQTAIDASVNAAPDQVNANLSGFSDARRKFADLVIRGRQGKQVGASWAAEFTSTVKANPTLYDSSPEDLVKLAKDTRDKAIGPRGNDAAFVANVDEYYQPALSEANAALVKAKSDQTLLLNIDAAKSEFAEITKEATVVGADFKNIAGRLSASLRLNEGAGIHPEINRTLAANAIEDLIKAGHLVEANALKQLVQLPSGHIIGNDVAVDAQLKQAERQMLSEQMQLESHARANEAYARAEAERAATAQLGALWRAGVTDLKDPRVQQAIANVAASDPAAAIQYANTLKSQNLADTTQAHREAAADAIVSMRKPDADLDSFDQRAMAYEFGLEGKDVLAASNTWREHRDRMAVIVRENPIVSDAEQKIRVIIESNAQFLLGEVGMGTNGDLNATQTRTLNNMINNELIRHQRQLVAGPMSEVIKRSDEYLDGLQKRVEGRAKQYRDTHPGAQYSTPKTEVDPLSPDIVKNSLPVFRALENAYTEGRAGRTESFRAKVKLWARAYINAKRAGVPEFGTNELVTIFNVHQREFPPGTTFDEFLKGIASYVDSSSPGAPTGK